MTEGDIVCWQFKVFIWGEDAFEYVYKTPDDRIANMRIGNYAGCAFSELVEGITERRYYIPISSYKIKKLKP